jgi:hypothetical protein
MSSFIISDGWRQFIVKKAGKMMRFLNALVNGTADFRSLGFSRRLQFNGALYLIQDAAHFLTSCLKRNRFTSGRVRGIP